MIDDELRNKGSSSSHMNSIYTNEQHEEKINVYRINSIVLFTVTSRKLEVPSLPWI